MNLELARLAGDFWQSEVFWYLGRSSGFVAYGLLAASLALGLAISTRMFDGLVTRAWFYELHKFCSLVVIVAALSHVLLFIPDQHLRLSPADLFIPLHAKTNPGPKVVAIGTLYLMVIVTGSFYLTRFIGQKAWRKLHYASFAVLIGATVHALWAGSDAQTAAVRLTYLGVGVLVVFLVFYRTLASRTQAPPKTRSGQRQTTAIS